MAGRITAGGMTREVAFEPGQSNADAIDEAYRKKYHGSPYPAAMIGSSARAATVKIVPRSVR
jgi:hypothetical protein